MAKFEFGDWVNPNPVKETSGEFIMRNSKKFSVGLSNNKFKDYKTFYSWKEVMESLQLSLDQIRRIRSGHMVWGWQLRHINGETFYRYGYSYIRKNPI